MKLPQISLLLACAATINQVAIAGGELAGASFANGQWVDLTHDFSDETIYWPTSDRFQKDIVAEGQTDAGYYYSAYKFSTAEHGGTHVDAPIHFFEDRNTVDQIPIEQLVGSGIVIRIDDKTQANRNYQLTVGDLIEWEKQNGKIAAQSIILIDTGSAQFWPNAKQYMGTEKRGAEGVAELEFPGIHPEAAAFLADERNIKAIGLDTPSIDYGGSKLFKTHQILFERNIPGIENLANLDQLPITGFTVIGLPMKIKGGSGSPLRIVAFISNQ